MIMKSSKELMALSRECSGKGAAALAIAAAEQARFESALIKMACREGIIEDLSYRTVRYGLVSDFQGEGILNYKDTLYVIKGYGPRGTGEQLTADGGVLIEKL
jgi:hypothetical protein